jgi:hypothetical protein
MDYVSQPNALLVWKTASFAYERLRKIKVAPFVCTTAYRPLITDCRLLASFPEAGHRGDVARQASEWNGEMIE